MMRVQFKEEEKEGNAQYLQEQLKNSQAFIRKQLVRQLIRQSIEFTEHKVYNSYRRDNKNYMEALFNHVSVANPEIAEIVNEPINDRINSVVSALWDQELNIPEKQENHLCDQQELFAQQMKERANDKKQSKNESKQKEPNSTQKKQKIQEFVKEQRKQQFQRKKKWEKLKKIQQQQLQKEQKQLAQFQAEKKKQKRQEILKKQKQRHQRRDQQKIIREERNSEYEKVRQKLNDQPPLYQKFYQRYERQSQLLEKSRVQSMLVERKHLLEHLSKSQFLEHEKKYQSYRSNQEKQRFQKLKMLKTEEKKRMKLYHSVDFVKGVDKRQIQREHGKQKRQKIKDFQKKLKQEYAPQIDEHKRSQLLNLITKMQMGHSKKVKNVKLENGQLYYEPLMNVDQKMIGNQYLGSVRQMVSKYRELTKKAEEKDEMKEDEDIKEKEKEKEKKKLDYLQQMKEMRKNSPLKEKRTFLDDRNLSYDEKVKRAIIEGEKKEKQAELKEEKLKFGKFKTAEEIVNYKWSIDKNYLDIVNMKLRLIE